MKDVRELEFSTKGLEPVEPETPEAPTTEAPANPPPTVAQKPLTVLELKSNYVHLPPIFFEKRPSPVQFGGGVFLFLKQFGLGKEESGTTKVLGYAFCGALNPVEIAVYAYLCFKPNSSVKELAKKRKLPPRLVAKTVESLEELGLVMSKGEERYMATLEDLEAEEPLLPAAAEAL